jgi:hypothetical protein
MEKEGFITDFGLEKAAEANVPRYGVWVWDDRHQKYAVVETSNDLRDLLFSYADFEVVPYYEEKTVDFKIGEEVGTPGGEGVITGIYGSNIRVIPSKVAGIEGFEEQVWDQEEIQKLSFEQNPVPNPKVKMEGPDAVGEKKKWFVAFPGYPTYETEAESKAQAMSNVVQRLMEASSNGKMFWADPSNPKAMEKWWGEAQIGNLLVKLRTNLERYVTDAPSEGAVKIDDLSTDADNLQYKGTPEGFKEPGSEGGTDQMVGPEMGGPQPTEDQVVDGLVDRFMKEIKGE